MGGSVRGWIATTVLVAGVVGLMLQCRPDPSEVRVLGGDQLASLSPYLDSGYRSNQGYGSVFVGTLTDAWATAERESRLEVAREIGYLLAVDEILLFDGQRRLRIHIVNDEFLYPVEDGS